MGILLFFLQVSIFERGCFYVEVSIFQLVFLGDFYSEGCGLRFIGHACKVKYWKKLMLSIDLTHLLHNCFC